MHEALSPKEGGVFQDFQDGGEKAAQLVKYVC